MGYEQFSWRSSNWSRTRLTSSATRTRTSTTALSTGLLFASPTRTSHAKLCPPRSLVTSATLRPTLTSSPATASQLDTLTTPPLTAPACCLPRPPRRRAQAHHPRLQVVCCSQGRLRWRPRDPTLREEVLWLRQRVQGV